MTAEEARRKVQHWLLDQVSYTMGAESPQLVLQETITIWQVPVVFTTSQIGRVGLVGQVEVDVQTGEIVCQSACREQLLQQAQTLAAPLPPYLPRTTMPEGYDQDTLPPLTHVERAADGLSSLLTIN